VLTALRDIADAAGQTRTPVGVGSDPTRSSRRYMRRIWFRRVDDGSALLRPGGQELMLFTEKSSARSANAGPTHSDPYRKKRRGRPHHTFTSSALKVADANKRFNGWIPTIRTIISTSRSS
jgi:hypothetical protein